MGIHHAKPHTLCGVVFDETRAKVRLGQVKTHILPLYQGFPAKVYNFLWWLKEYQPMVWMESAYIGKVQWVYLKNGDYAQIVVVWEGTRKEAATVRQDGWYSMVSLVDVDHRITQIERTERIGYLEKMAKKDVKAKLYTEHRNVAPRYSLTSHVAGKLVYRFKKLTPESANVKKLTPPHKVNAHPNRDTKP
ncbi:hypothetical protein Tco_0437978 [Tanacetum coccineum]